MKIKCEVCQCDGERTEGTYCPPGWLYGMSSIEPEDELSGLSFGDGERRLFISYVCSLPCGARFWCQGPGSDDMNAPSIEEQDKKRADAE